MNLCVCDNEQSEYGEDSEDVVMGWVCSMLSCYVRPDVSLTSADVRPQVT